MGIGTPEALPRFRALPNWKKATDVDVSVAFDERDACEGVAFHPIFYCMYSHLGNPWLAGRQYLIGLALIAWLASATSEASGNDTLLTAVQQHCSDCHAGSEQSPSDVMLAGLTTDTLLQSPDLINRLIGVLDRREMPPADAEELPADLRDHLLATLRKIEREALAFAEPVMPPIRRMTRFQYNNAVIDLFGLRCLVFTLPERLMRDHKGYFRPETGVMADVVHVGNRPLGKSQLIEPRLAGVAAFPQDLRAEHGYDNQADHLSLSPLLMEAFLSLGQSITESPDFTRKNVGIWDAFFKPPSDDTDHAAVIRERLTPFLTKAFRQKIDAETLGRYTRHAVGKLAQGEDFTTVMKSIAAAVVASPRFLYLHDTAARSDLALAARLSFFLWGSLPDERLLELAAGGTLSRPDVFHAEITRMLADRKLKRFCDSFPAQWLQLDRLISSVPDRKQYPQFYFSKYRDSMHMMLEPLLLFETVLIEDLPITQLIDADFTYRSGHLENSYGMLATPKDRRPTGKAGEVTSLTFHRVPVTDRRNGGLITNAAVMTMTSGPERTKPITRGAWVASVIFNTPPPPPPADVPPLAEHPSGDEAMFTLRERLAMHRERADCRGCHERIDPLGFALENYDAVGGWRDHYDNGREVDAAGVLFQSLPFSDPIEFKDAILAEKVRFTEALAGHLLAFALARELTPADRPVIRAIARRTAANGDRMQALLREVLTSHPFQYASAITSNQTVTAEEH